MTITGEWVSRTAAAGESETLEFKTTTGTRREAARTVCAMLNQQGGHVLFGVTPEGRVAGQQVRERTLEQVSAELARIGPKAFPSIQRVPVGESREVLVVSVERGDTRPYEYRGKAWRRVGTSTLAMSVEERNRMLFERLHGRWRWETFPATEWSVDDLDEAEIRNTVAEAVRIGRLNEPGHRDTAGLLRGLGLVREGALLRAAAVLFGRTERLEYEMPQCLLRVARFRGTDRSEFLDNRQFTGNAFTLLSSGERFLRDTLPISSRFTPDRFQRIDEPLYPPLATREALANALCHRDYAAGGGSIGLAVYDDRLEVTSTGGLPFGLTPDKLFDQHESRPWNPLIARVFHRRGLIEEWGRGTLRMAEFALEAGLPRPEIEDSGDCVTVRFRRPKGTNRRSERGPAGRQDTILAMLGTAKEGLSLRALQARLPVDTTTRQVKRALAHLRERGLAQASGRGPASRWVRTPNRAE